MNLTYSLNGKHWQLKSFYGEDWRLRQSHLPDSLDRRAWLPAQVPGSVLQDVWQDGQTPNPYEERNSLMVEWTAARSWVYKRTFIADRRWKNGSDAARVRLRFKGVDYDAHFFLNGQPLGEHHSMYTPVTFEIGDRLDWEKDNLLAVVIDPAPVEWPQIGYTSQVRTLKARMNYWWDFSPRFVHQGIWDDVDLLVSGPAAIENIWIRPRLAPGYGSARITGEVEVSLLQPATVEVELNILHNGATIAQVTRVEKLPAGVTDVPVETQIEQPDLWWPNGFGAQPLYSAEVILRCVDCEGKADSDSRSVTFGIREIQFVANEDASPEARPYTLTVNGQRIYIRGWNWVPMDVLYGVERPARLRHLLLLAGAAHVNLLRVWGGGLIEKEAFYELCDRLGILVWQEFIQSSSGLDNNAPEDPEFIAWVSQQAGPIVKGRRNHPSLAIWCGGNELMRPDGVPLEDNHPMLAALKSVVAELDPDRTWLPTSSSGPVFGNSLEKSLEDPASLHDVHGPWEYQGVEKQYALYNGTTSLFHSEFGAEGLTNRRTLNCVIQPEHQWPVSLDNPLWYHLAAWWVKEKVWKEVFGSLPDVDSLQRATQFIQFEGVRYAIEANRRRCFHNSGSIPWQFNEPYPMAACTSAVDYYGMPKPMYYGVRRAYAPVSVSARYSTLAWAGKSHFEAEVYVTPAEGKPTQAVKVIWRLVGLDGAEYARGEASASLSDDHARKMASISFPTAQLKEDVFFLDLRAEDAPGQMLAENRYLFTHAADLSPIFGLPPAQLHSQVARLGSDWLVTVSNPGRTAVLYAQLDLNRDPCQGGWARLDDNYFTLFPGEQRQVRVTWDGVPAEEQRLALWAWNVPETILS